MTENKNRKILYVATVVKTHIMHFHLPYFEMLKEEGWQVDVAARNDYENPSDCKIPNCDNYYNIEFDRNPFSIANIRAYKELKNIIDKGEYDIVHCHTPVAGVLTRIAARKARSNGTKVIYTAHGFQFYKGGKKKDWIIFYPVEKICSFFTDVLIAINGEDYELARHKFSKKLHIEFVKGVGIEIEKFKSSNLDLKKKRLSLGLAEGKKVILSVGELTRNKNQIEVLRALKEIDDIRNIKYLIVGDGENRHELEEYIGENNLNEHVALLGYRTDVNELYKISDLFIMPSIREGLPVALMEAIASGINVIASNIRGNRDLLDVDSLYESGNIIDLKNKIQSNLISKPCENNLIQEYDISVIKESVRKIYETA